MTPLLDFVVLGAPRAGTSTLLHHLRRQPALFLPPHKPRYWALERRPDWQGPGDDALLLNSVTEPHAYAALFSEAPPNARCGEVSDLYLYDAGAARALERHAPEARLVALLRHPVDRAYSAYWIMRRRGLEPMPTFEQALAAEPERVRAGWSYAWHYARVGAYAAQLERYAAALASGRLLVLSFESFTDDVAAGVERCMDHIGAPMTPVRGADARHNAGGVPRSAAAGGLERLRGGEGWMRRLARNVVPLPLRRRIAGSATMARLASRAVHYPPMGAETRRSLLASFADDVARVESLLGRSLPEWRR